MVRIRFHPLGLLLAACLLLILVGCATDPTPLPGDTDPPAELGALQVDFRGLPGPWPDGGYALLVGPDGAEAPLVESSVLTDLPEGTFRLEAQPLPLCGVEYLPRPASAAIEVEADTTAVATIDYAPSVAGALRTQGYRASVVGVHSNANDILMDVTLVSAAGRLVAFGCTLSDTGTAGVTGAEVRDGNVKDFFVEDAPTLAAFDVTDESCAAEGGYVHDCTSYVYGAQDLTADDAQALDAGRLYMRVPTTLANGSNLLAQIVPDSGDTGVGTGGDLEVVVHASGMPAEVREAFLICIDGRFDLGLADDICTREDAVYSDLYSGTYEAFVDGAGLDRDDFEITGAPAEVRPGTTATIGVRYIGPE